MSERTDDLMIKYMLLDTYIERRVDKRVDVEGWERRTPHTRRNIRVVTVVDTMTPNLRDMKIQGV